VSAFLLIAVAALVAANGFFVAAEFALVRSRRARVEALASAQVAGAALALRQLSRIDEYLAACQLGITMASLGIGFLGEPAIARLLEEPLGNVVSHAAAVAISITVAYLIVTGAHITVGEQVPKIYAITDAEGTVRFVATPLEWFRVASRPLIWARNSLSNAMLRLIGTDPRAELGEGASSAEELRLLIAESAVGGALEPSEAEMLSGVFHLHERQARQVMTPFHALVTVTADDDVKSALERCIESGRSRLLVTEAGRGVVGSVHANSLAHGLLTRGPDSSVGATVKPVYLIPETKPLDTLLAELQGQRATIAVVADEYGGTAGIVTIEDIVEEIVGEITDETDPIASAVRLLANGDWYVQGEVPLLDLPDHGISLPVDPRGATTVGGLLFAEFGRIPRIGELLHIGGYSLRVESIRGNRIAAVRIRDDQRTDRERQSPTT